MPRIKLTKSSIDALPTPSSDVVYWDAAYPGFGVKITPKGRKVFIVLYRTGGAGSYLRLSKNRSVVEISRLLRREVGKPWAGRSIHEYLAPLFGFLGDELTEAGGRARKHRDPQSVEPRFYSGIGETGIDLLVELINDFGGCVLWRADAEPDTRTRSPAQTRPQSGHPEALQSGPQMSPPADAGRTRLANLLESGASLGSLRRSLRRADRQGRVTLSGAQFEILVDGTPRSYRDLKLTAMRAARFY